eukprot:TRINITY_DN6831_c0_g1_i4.p1 TRINITY_DN6831_c0_g1~~TRINITY_DN6831_c0_g1_i4.p1  ORF type:complete len:714 (-),score=123.87 TRINITY_DN6831_c0_g1_i4:42-2150(-)
MELRIIGQENIDADCIVSVQSGPVKRQTNVATGRPFRFQDVPSHGEALEINILKSIGKSYLVLRPGEDCYRVNFKGGDALDMKLDVEVKQGQDDGRPGLVSPEATMKSVPSAAAQEAKDYLDQHKILHFVQAMLQVLVKQKPADPYACISSHARSGYTQRAGKEGVETADQREGPQGAAFAELPPDPQVAPGEPPTPEFRPGQDVECRMKGEGWCAGKVAAVMTLEGRVVVMVKRPQDLMPHEFDEVRLDSKAATRTKAAASPRLAETNPGKQDEIDLVPDCETNDLPGYQRAYVEPNWETTSGWSIGACRYGHRCTDYRWFHRQMFTHEDMSMERVRSTIGYGRWELSADDDVHSDSWEVLPQAESRAADLALCCRLTARGPSKVLLDGDCRLNLDLMTRFARGRNLPIRRCKEGDEDGSSFHQTHPDPNEAHPYDTLRVSRAQVREGDWLTNDFFFRAFCEAVKQGDPEAPLDFTPEDLFDFRFNQDCRWWTAESTPIYRRGGVLYRAPFGWKRFAMKVKHRFDDGDDTWMGMDGKPGEWAVAYHGTNFSVVPKIVRNGFKIGSGCGGTGCPDVRTGVRIKDGVYCTPNLQVVECYANGEEHDLPCVELEGRKIFFAFVCRVHPDAIRRPYRHFAYNNDEEQMGIDGVFEWIIEDPKHIRPYAILAREHTSDAHADIGQLVCMWNDLHSPLPRDSFAHIH